MIGVPLFGLDNSGPYVISRLGGSPTGALLITGPDGVAQNFSGGSFITGFNEGITIGSDGTVVSSRDLPFPKAGGSDSGGSSGPSISGSFYIPNALDFLDGLLATLEAPLPDGYHEVVEEAGAVRKALDAAPVPLAPCHCDPLSENFLDDGARMWVVDWEYSGMNDPLWDLGDVSVEAGFDEDQDREMMAAYCGGEPPAAVYGRMVIYKAMCDLLWTLWGLIQFANKNPVDDFWAYSLKRFERCKALMGAEDFGGHLGAIGSGARLTQL